VNAHFLGYGFRQPTPAPKRGDYDHREDQHEARRAFWAMFTSKSSMEATK
jgi:hypothetical protein